MDGDSRPDPANQARRSSAASGALKRADQVWACTLCDRAGLDIALTAVLGPRLWL